MTFRYTDEAIACLDRRLIERFSRLKSLLSVDEINPMGEINDLYTYIRKLTRQIYGALADRVYRDSREQDLTGLRSLDEEWVDALLSGYDPVSKYVFDHELDRKCARLIEAVLSSDTPGSEVDRALRAVSYQCRIYADRVTDEAVMQAYNDEGESYVRWVAELDEKTCRVCRQRNGHIYEIDAVPPDPHPNCRCRRERVIPHD